MYDIIAMALAVSQCCFFFKEDLRLSNYRMQLLTNLSYC